MLQTSHMDAMDFQQDTLDWVQETNPLFYNNSYNDSYFDAQPVDSANNICPTLTWDGRYWDESCVDLKAFYSSPSLSLSNPVSPLSDTLEPFNSTEFQASPNIKPEEQLTASSRSTSPETVASIAEARKICRVRQQMRHTVSSPKLAQRMRVPHKQVERKYRHGINTMMEELRMSIPSTAHWESSSSSPTNLKPSKAMVLACAVNYIREVEKERDDLAKKMESMKR
jgi:hypothetical protein